MPATTNLLIVKAKVFAASAGVFAAFLFACPGQAAAAPADDASIAPLIALDNAVEAVAARVTPSVVNVAVTARVAAKAQNFGGIDPEDLPPGFQQFFFGQGGQGQKQQPQIEHCHQQSRGR
jgi:serine protease Do